MANSKRNESAAAKGAAANVGYDAQRWQMGDSLRGSMDAFDEQHPKPVAEQATGASRDGSDEYRPRSICRMPPEARWQYQKAQACCLPSDGNPNFLQSHRNLEYAR